jgi:hypothetical protein
MRVLFFTLISFSSATTHSVHGAVISLTQAAPNYTQNFDTLALSNPASPLLNTAVPAGWFFLETGENANTGYSAGIGSGSTGDTYSFGDLSSSERAFGELTTGTLNSTLGANIVNGDSAAIQSLSISYTGERWRLGATGRSDRLDFEYSLNSTSLSTGTWTDLDTLDFSSPLTSGLTGAKNGNLAANRTSLSGNLTSLSMGNNQALWIRWISTNITGADDGLAIDDFTITATFATTPAAVPEPAFFIVLLLAGVFAAGSRRYYTHRRPAREE